MILAHFLAELSKNNWIENTKTIYIYDVLRNCYELCKFNYQDFWAGSNIQDYRKSWKNL